MFVGAGFVGEMLAQSEGVAAFGTGMLIFLAIILLALAVLSFFVARGLWKAKSWARITAIILSILGVIFAIIGMVGGEIGSNILGLILNGLIGAYLLFSEEVKKAFA
jgi:uncharacterized membrane protein (DUF2068 family)